MPRSPAPIPNRLVNLSIKEDLYSRLYLMLFSTLEAKLPYGAWNKFFEARIREFLEHRELDLAPWLEVPAGACVVKGSPETIRMLQKLLTEASL